MRAVQRFTSPQSAALQNAAPQNAAPQVLNHLYVVTGSTSPKTNRITLRLLEWILESLPHINRMGVKVRVHRVPQSKLSEKRLREALKKKSITSLPALVTARTTYAGYNSIVAMYEKEIARYLQWERKTTQPLDDVESSLDRFYQSEMTFQKVEADKQRDGEDSMTETAKMLAQYRDHQARRAGSAPPNHDNAATPSSPPPPERQTNLMPQSVEIGQGGDHVGDQDEDDKYMSKFLENAGLSPEY